MGTTVQRNELFFKLLNKCPGERLDKLIHHLIDLFCGHKTVLYEEFSDVWSLIDWWDVIRESKVFFQNCYNENSDIEILPEEYKNIIKESISVRKTDIRNSLLEKSYAISPSYLTDFDWKLKLNIASDTMAQINEPRLLLDLDLSGNTSKSLQLDLSKEELKTLIDSMEKAKKALADVTVLD